MAIFKKDTLVESYPAYDVYTREKTSEGYINITTEDRLGLKRTFLGGKYYDEFYAGSVVSFALENNDCPLRAIERAKENGHELHWLNAFGTIISNSKKSKEKLIKVEIGMLVKFEGHIFKIVTAPNDNLSFEPIE